jgi:hypothetical protein
MKTSYQIITDLLDWISTLAPTIVNETEVEQIVKETNATERILFNSKEFLYEKLKTFLFKTLILDSKVKVNPNDYEDIVSDFMCFLVEKDKLKDYEFKKLNFNAVYFHFSQFITREKYSNAQDVQRRLVDRVRTQAEQMSFKKGLPTKEFIPESTFKVLVKKDEEGNSERDFVSVEKSPEEHTISNTTTLNMNTKILKLFKSEYGEQWKPMFDIYNHKLNETYENFSEWSKEEGISLPSLKNRWGKIQNLLKRKGSEYLQSQPSKEDNIEMMNKWILSGCPNLI